MSLVPTVARSPIGILALILNIIPGGIGSIVAGASAKDTKTIVFGVLQFVLGFVVVGWIWSIVWGILIFKESA